MREYVRFSASTLEMSEEWTDIDVGWCRDEPAAPDRRIRNRALTNTRKHAVWTLLQAYQDELDRADTYDNNDILSAALRSATHQSPTDPAPAARGLSTSRYN